jgi:hypothetical protein
MTKPRQQSDAVVSIALLPFLGWFLICNTRQITTTKSLPTQRLSLLIPITVA